MPEAPKDQLNILFGPIGETQAGDPKFPKSQLGIAVRRAVEIAFQETGELLDKVVETRDISR